MVKKDIYEVFGTTKKEVEDIVNDIEMYYLSYPIPKRTGKRSRYINAPQDRLKELQENFLREVLYKFQTNQIAHGFVIGRDPKTNALEHVGAVTLIKVDLKDFFPSIRGKMVHAMLNLLLPKIHHAITYQDCALLSKFLTYRDKVPQGAPTSPAITNLYCANLDTKLKQLAESKGCVVTRYADDITISNPTQRIDRSECHKIVRQIARYCQAMGLRLNRDKTRIRHNSSRLSVTGVVVNKKPNLPNPKYRILRAQVHNFLIGKTVLTEEEKQSLRGRLEWMRSINPIKAAPLLEKFGKALQKS